MDTIFSLSSLLVMPFWAAMILLPRWRWTRRAVGSPWIVAPAAVLYTVLVLPRIAALWPVVSGGTLATVAALLGTPEGAAIGWVHFLAFDLFVGRWAYLDSLDRGVSSWAMAPVLFGTLMFGPLGYLLYLGVRGVPALRERSPASAGRAAQDRADPAAASAREAVGQGVARRFRAGLAVDRPLTLVAALMVPLFLLSLVGIALDPTVVTGSRAWVKPMKFALSISIYSFTLLWMLSLVEGHRRAVRAVGTLTAVALLVEWVVIALQAYRGIPSHFNASTAFDATLFSAMGVFIVVFWVMNLVAAVLLLRQRFSDRAFAWSLRLGLLLSLVGGVAATPMLGPTPEQRTALRAGERVEVIGGHAVGVRDGGPGLPITGWSTDGGDVRVAHFFGLHGLQVLPLLGFLLLRSRLGEGPRLALVWTGGLAYLGATIILLRQALRGEPLVAPGPDTLTEAGLLAGTVLLAISAVLWSARRRTGGAAAVGPARTERRATAPRPASPRRASAPAPGSGR